MTYKAKQEVIKTLLEKFGDEKGVNGSLVNEVVHVIENIPEEEPQNEALDMAIDALKKQESWAKEPLTMQELRKMDGQTVYCLDLNMEVTVFAPEKGLINVSNGAFILQARNATLYRDWPKEDN